MNCQKAGKNRLLPICRPGKVDENFGNGREARALFEKVSVQMAKRLMGSENGEQKNTLSEKAIKQCRISDIEGAIRRAREENKQISGRVKVHNRIGF